MFGDAMLMPLMAMAAHANRSLLKCKDVHAMDEVKMAMENLLNDESLNDIGDSVFNVVDCY